MSFPASLTTRTVKGRFVTYPAGVAAKGKVRIVLNDFMQGPTDDAFVAAFDETIKLDSNGAFSTILPASNDPQWTSSYYRITITIGEKIVRSKFDVPYDETEALDLSDVLNLPAVTPGESYVLLASKGAPGGVASLGEDGYLVVGQRPPGSVGAAVSWDDIEDKPVLFPHNEVTYSQVTGKPTLFPPVAHDHPMSNVEGLEDALAGKSDTGHIHTTSDISGLSVAFAGKADVSALTSGLAGKSDTGHTHIKSEVGLTNVDDTSDANKPVSTAQQTALNLKAPLASPTLTGTPSAPTAAGGTNTAQIATTAFVTSAVAPKADASSVTSALALKADLVSGIIPTSQIPALAINETYEAASQAAMLALTAQRGDVAIRTDFTPNRVYFLASDSPSTLADWKEITAAGSVVTVNGQSGVVVLGKGDVGLANVDNTTDPAKPVSTAQQTALDLKAPLVSPTFTGTVSGITKGMVGLGNADNTTDTAKPISDATIAALALKLNKATNTQYVSDYIPSGFDTTGSSCYTYIMQAVTAAGVGGKIVFNGRFRCDTEIALLNYQVVSGLIDWMAAGGGIQTTCVDFRQVTANTSEGNSKVGFRYAASNIFENLMIAGPGTDVVGSKGVAPPTGTEYAPRFSRVSFYNWEVGASLLGAYYSDFIDCSWQLNGTGVVADTCYNLSFYKPRMRCSNIDLTSFGTGIEIVGVARGLKIIGGSIENYTTGIKGASFSDISVHQTYFEMYSTPAGAFAGAVSIDAANKTYMVVSVTDCTVYLHRHIAFVNGTGSGLSVLVGKGNQFIYSDMALTPAPTTPFCYNILSSFGDVELGPDNARLMYYHATNQPWGYTPNIWGSGALLDYKVTFPRGDQTGRDSYYYMGRNIMLPPGKTIIAADVTRPFAAKTSAYTATTSDNVITADATSAAFTVTLPTAVGLAGRSFTIKRINTGANAVTVATTSSQTIDGVTTYVLTIPQSSVRVISDGSNWITISFNAINSFVAKTAAYTATTSDNVITADATSAAFTVTLPTAVGATGKAYTVKRINTNANAVTLATTSSQTIDGVTTYILTIPHSSATVVSDGANWRLVGNDPTKADLTTYNAEKAYRINYVTGVADQKADIYFTGSFFATIDVTLTGLFSGANAGGTVRAVYSLATNGTSTSYVNKMDYTLLQGTLPDHFALSAASWDAANSRWKITISHRTTSANAVSALVKWQANTPADSTAIRDGIGVSAVYTTDTSVPAVPAVAGVFSAKTAAYTLTGSDSFITADATSAAFSVTLPTAVGLTGKSFTIKRINTGLNAVTIATTSSQTIDGVTTYVLTIPQSTVEVISDGSNWRVANKEDQNIITVTDSRWGTSPFGTNPVVALAAATAGQTVFFPPGTYTPPTGVGNGYTVMADNVKIVAGRGVTINVPTWGAAGIDCFNRSGVTVEGGLTVSYTGTRGTHTGTTYRGSAPYVNTVGVYINRDRCRVDGLRTVGMVTGVFLSSYDGTGASDRTGVNNTINNLEVEGANFGILWVGQKSLNIDGVYGHDDIDDSSGANPTHVYYASGNSTLKATDVTISNVRAENILYGQPFQLKYCTNVRLANHTARNCRGVINTIDVFDLQWDGMGGTDILANSGQGAITMQMVTAISERCVLNNVVLKMATGVDERAVRLHLAKCELDNWLIETSRPVTPANASDYEFYITGNDTRIKSSTIRSLGAGHVRAFCSGNTAIATQDVSFEDFVCENTVGLLDVTVGSTGGVIKYNPAAQKGILSGGLYIGPVGTGTAPVYTVSRNEHERRFIFSSTSGNPRPNPYLETQLYVDVSDSTAMTIVNPLGGTVNVGTTVNVVVANNSGGTMGAVTWNAAYVLMGTYVKPAAGEATVHHFRFNGTSWVEIYSNIVLASKGDLSSNTTTTVDSEMALFSGTAGKTVKRATATGIAKLTSGVVSAVTAPSGAIVGDTDTQTLTNKRVTARVTATASSSTPTPNADTDDQYNLTALAANATFGAPTGTPTAGQSLIIRIKDNGTARTLAWNAIFRAIGVALPSTTVISKTMYVGCRYNSTDTKWDVLAVSVEA